MAGKTGNWSARSVLRVVHNPVHVGQLRDGAPGALVPTVDRELFERVATKTAERRTRRPGRVSRAGADPFVLRGLLVCAKCGKRMTTSAQRPFPSVRESAGENRLRDRYYRCRTAGCGGAHVPALAMERAVLDALAVRSGERDDIDALFERIPRVGALLTWTNSRGPRPVGA